MKRYRMFSSSSIVCGTNPHCWKKYDATGKSAYKIDIYLVWFNHLQAKKLEDVWCLFQQTRLYNSGRCHVEEALRANECIRFSISLSYFLLLH